jgi:hypothetical protein
MQRTLSMKLYIIYLLKNVTYYTVQLEAPMDRHAKWIT